MAKYDKLLQNMKNISRTDPISDIIEEWFNNEFENEEDEERVRQIFFNWLASEQDREQKEKVIERLMATQMDVDQDKSMGHSYDKYVQFIESQGSIDTSETKPLKAKRRFLLQKTSMRVAAIVIPLLIVGAGLWYLEGSDKDDSHLYTQLYSVDNGATKEVELPDSTHVKINSGSNMSVQFEKHSRSVRLTGEAFFDVTSDAQKPFVVQTDELTIKVLGTKFNIEAYAERDITTVLLMEGAVSLLENSGREWNLKPNELYVYDKNSRKGTVQNLSNQEIVDMASWSQGRVVYSYRTLEDIFGIIERRFAVDIEVDPDLDLASTEYVIQIDPEETPEMIIDAFAALTEKFTYKIEGNKIVILPFSRE